MSDHDPVEWLLKNIPRETCQPTRDLRNFHRWWRRAYREVFPNGEGDHSESRMKLAYTAGQIYQVILELCDVVEAGQKKSTAQRDDKAAEAAARSFELEASGDKGFIRHTADEYAVSERTIHRWRKCYRPLTTRPPK